MSIFSQKVIKPYNSGITNYRLYELRMLIMNRICFAKEVCLQTE